MRLVDCRACKGGAERYSDGGPFGPCCPDCMNTGYEFEEMGKEETAREADEASVARTARGTEGV